MFNFATRCKCSTVAVSLIINQDELFLVDLEELLYPVIVFDDWIQLVFDTGSLNGGFDVGSFRG
jgi:hypothetical protein